MANRTSNHRKNPPASRTQPPAPMSGGLKVGVVLICVIMILLFALLLYRGRGAQAQAASIRADAQRTRTVQPPAGDAPIRLGDDESLVESILSGELDPREAAQEHLGLEEEDLSGEIILNAYSG